MQTDAQPLRLGEDGRILRIPTPTGLGVGDIHSYLLLPEADSEELVLIDTGVRSEAAWAALERGLALVDRRIEDITRVMLTHAHPDHFGQAGPIAEVARCEIWSHVLAAEGIARYTGELPVERREQVYRFWERLGVPGEIARRDYGPPGGTSIVAPCTPDRLLEDGERIEAAGFALEVIHVPGHCPDLVVYWHEETGTVFAGDHLLPDITPVCLLDIPERADGPRSHSLAQFHRSIDKVEPLRVRLLCPSHGDPLHSHRRLIEFYRVHTAERVLKIARRLQRKESYTAFELSKLMFPKAWESQLHLVLSEVVGHLDILEEGGHAEVELRDGVLHYVFRSLPEPRSR